MARAARRLILYFAAGVAALLLLVILGVAALVLFVDADRFRPRIEQAAEASLGRPLSLGRLHWDLGRRVALRTEGGWVANPPGYDGAQLVSWRSLEFGLALWPLLRRRDARIDHLSIEGLVVDLQRRADGRANWEFSSPRSDTAAPERAAGSGQGIRFALDSLALQGASVRFRDEAAARDIALTSLDLSMQLPPDLMVPRLQVTDVMLDARLQERPVRLRAPTVGLVREGPAFELPDFEAVFDEVTASGRLQGSFGDAPAVDAQLRAAVPSLRRQMERLGRPLSAMQDADAPGPVALEARIRLADGAVSLDELVLRVDDTTLKGHVELPSLDPLSVRFDLDADSIVVDRYLTPPDVQSSPYALNVSAMRSIDAKGTLRVAQLAGAGAAARQSVITVE